MGVLLHCLHSFAHPYVPCIHRGIVHTSLPTGRLTQRPTHFDSQLSATLQMACYKWHGGIVYIATKHVNNNNSTFQQKR